jgi:hypothetical protein
MAVNWLKGLVAPAAQFGAATIQGSGMGAPPPQANDAPPIGGGPNPYGVMPPQAGQMQMPPAQPAMPPAIQQAPMGGLPDAMQWTTGTRTQGAAQAATGGAGASLAGGDRVAVLEARCAELSNDVASLALFARTLLTLLEDGKVVTRAQFMDTKSRLDALDGKIDDR